MSDGMGSGERALQESGMLVEMLEELLGAGFPVETALSMINTALVMGREEVRFSTVDMSIFDLYNGKCEFVKAGAAVTFLRTKDGVEHIRSESLPLGVIQRQQSEKETRQLESGDVVVMVSDRDPGCASGRRAGAFTGSDDWGKSAGESGGTGELYSG